MSLDAPGLVPSTLSWALGAAVWAAQRSTPEPPITLHPSESAYCAQLGFGGRREEWLWGRYAAKAACASGFGLDPKRLAILPGPRGEPQLTYAGGLETPLTINISHTTHWAVACAATSAVGVDICEDKDGPRLERIGERAVSPEEAKRCEIHGSPARQAALWAIKESVLKLRTGGVFVPGAASVRVLSLVPARVDPTLHATVSLLRLPDAAVAVSRISSP